MAAANLMLGAVVVTVTRLIEKRCRSHEVGRSLLDEEPPQQDHSVVVLFETEEGQTHGFGPTCGGQPQSARSQGRSVLLVGTTRLVALFEVGDLQQSRSRDGSRLPVGPHGCPGTIPKNSVTSVSYGGQVCNVFSNWLSDLASGCLLFSCCCSVFSVRGPWARCSLGVALAAVVSLSGLGPCLFFSVFWWSPSQKPLSFRMYIPTPYFHGNVVENYFLVIWWSLVDFAREAREHRLIQRGVVKVPAAWRPGRNPTRAALATPRTEKIIGLPFSPRFRKPDFRVGEGNQAHRCATPADRNGIMALLHDCLFFGKYFGLDHLINDVDPSGWVLQPDDADARVKCLAAFSPVLRWRRTERTCCTTATTYGEHDIVVSINLGMPSEQRQLFLIWSRFTLEASMCTEGVLELWQVPPSYAFFLSTSPQTRRGRCQ